MNLKEMAVEVEQVNREHGWYDDERTFGDDIALLHSELSEALEAYRQWEFKDFTKLYILRNDGEIIPCDNPKPEGVGSELADVLIRLLDTAARRGIDLEAEYHRKVAYNKTRGYRHGGKKLLWLKTSRACLSGRSARLKTLSARWQGCKIWWMRPAIPRLTPTSRCPGSGRCS